MKNLVLWLVFCVVLGVAVLFAVLSLIAIMENAVERACSST